MRLITFVPQTIVSSGSKRRPGALVDLERGTHVVDLVKIRSIEWLINAGPHAWSAVRDQVANTNPESMIPIDKVKLVAPISRANSLRDFVAFEDHARAGAARRNEELNPIWSERPLYYKGNHRSIIGPDAQLKRPSFTKELDLEMEVAAVIATSMTDASVDDASQSIFGFTIMNDWSARDVQRAEMAARLGPAKSKDFATSLGPCIVTADEFGDLTHNPRLQMRARVNDNIICEASLGDAHWSFAQMISFVSQGERVWPTDIYGSGTPFGGCMLDQGGPWLEPGDTVELEVEKLGVLRNTIC